MTITPGTMVLSTNVQARDYIDRVEAADEAASPGIGGLESAVKESYKDFIMGCLRDGIWYSIKSCCILAGARTLAGALVPLVGTAPDKYGTEGNWNYNRKTGLKGDGGTNYLNSNRNNNADPQNNNHNALYLTTLPTVGAGLMGAGTGGEGGDTNVLVAASRSRNASAASYSSSLVSGFAGHSRSTSTGYEHRANGVSQSITQASTTPFDGNVFVFARSSAFAIAYADPRLSFYSIGESLDLALLDTRVSTLMTDLGAAIP